MRRVGESSDAVVGVNQLLPFKSATKKVVTEGTVGDKPLMKLECVDVMCVISLIVHKARASSHHSFG